MVRQTKSGSKSSGENRANKACSQKESLLKKIIHYPDSSSYEGSLKDGEPHGEGKLIFANEAVFEGRFRYGQFNGFGTLHEKGVTKEGMWKDGKLEGEATFFFPGGHTVQGVCVEGIMSRGTIVYQEGCVYKRYEGSLKDGHPDGQGKMVFSNGAIFEGTFEEFGRKMSGMYTTIDGTLVKGFWENAKLHGEATMLYPDPDGRRIEGYFEEDILLKGTIHYPAGSFYKSYEGSLKNELPDGEGKLTFADERVFQGSFKNGEFDGPGELTQKNGFTKKGVWKEGKLEGEVTMLHSDGRLIKGCLEENILRHGQIFYPAGSFYKSYKGSLKNEQPDGEGELIYANEAVFKGAFKSGQIQCFGQLTDANRVIRRGMWEDGRLQGEGEILYPDGRSIIGNFILDIPEEATIFYPEGSFYKRYKGSLKNEQPDGEGELVYANRAVFRGAFKDGQIQGFGQLTDANLVTRRGMWEDGRLQGKGEILYPDGRGIIGNFILGMPEEATIFFPKDSVYKRYHGFLKDLDPHGRGELIFSNGSSLNGVFENGQFSYGTLTEKDGTTKTGMWQNGCLHGEGVILYRSGRRIEGEFVAGMISFGAVVYEEGSIYKCYKGFLKDEKPHGEGVVTFSDETVFKGTFKNGQPLRPE